MKFILWVICLVFGFWFGFQLPNNFKEDVCIQKSIIKEIVSVRYRTATVKLADGSLKEMDQPSIKPGDETCAKWSRQ